METSKICTKCLTRKYLKQFTYIKSKNIYESRCKYCTSLYKKEYRKKNIEKIKEQSKIYHQENKDKINARASKYYEDNKNKVLDRLKKDYEKNRIKKLAYSKEYRSRNKKKISKAKREYNKKNKENHNEYRKEYRVKNKDRLLKRERNYREKNIEKIKSNHKKYNEKNKEELKIYRRKYYKTIKGISSKRNTEHKRRTKYKDGDVKTSEINNLFATVKNCYWCNKQLCPKQTHIDHYVPLSKGGKHTISNLVLTCSKCNLKKSSKDPLQFANQIGRLF